MATSELPIATDGLTPVGFTPPLFDADDVAREAPVSDIDLERTSDVLLVRAAADAVIRHQDCSFRLMQREVAVGLWTAAALITVLEQKRVVTAAPVHAVLIPPSRLPAVLDELFPLPTGDHP